MKTAIIIGGGLAGLVAARALVISGRYRTLILESKPVLGGLAASWRDSSGALIEAGLHVCFPHYRNVLGLLEEVGASGSITWSSPTLRYLRDNGDVAELRFPRLPPPLHSAVAVARHGHLSVADCLSAVIGAVEATLFTQSWRSRYESISFSEWAERRKLSQRLVQNVFEPMIRGLTFLRGNEVSARAILDYIYAVSSRADLCKVGMFRAGSGEVLIDPIAKEVTGRGGEIRTCCTVRALTMRGGRATGVRLDDGTTLCADLVIAATPSHVLREITLDAAPDNPAIRRAARLTSLPVVSAMVWFDRRIGGPSGLRFSPDCVFSTWIDMADVLSELVGSDRSVLQLVVAPMDSLMTLDDLALAALVVTDIRRILPGARPARINKIVLTRSPKSLIAATPGAEALRPDTDVGIPGLVLAGHYVNTGHSANMESAAISGVRAARFALEVAA